MHAGTLNLDAPVDVRVTAAGSATSLAEIARLMEAAGQSRSAYVRIADRASRWYAPAVHTLALASFAGWMLLGAVVQSRVVGGAVRDDFLRHVHGLRHVGARYGSTYGVPGSDCGPSPSPSSCANSGRAPIAVTASTAIPAKANRVLFIRFVPFRPAKATPWQQQVRHG